jgi:hypothetical protein
MNFPTSVGREFIRRHCSRPDQPIGESSRLRYHLPVLQRGDRTTQPVCSALRGVFLELYSMKSILVFGRPI